jgi:starch phosphorylase
MLNGALTLGTLDGANIEIFDAVGTENAFVFGLTAAEIAELEASHKYSPQVYLANDLRLTKVLGQLVDGTYAPDTQVFRELYDSLVYGVEGQRPDIYYVLADFDAYRSTHEKIAAEYADKRGWAKKVLLNIANSGKFSSDRTIEEYVRDIWKLDRITIQ